MRLQHVESLRHLRSGYVTSDKGWIDTSRALKLGKNLQGNPGYNGRAVLPLDGLGTGMKEPSVGVRDQFLADAAGQKARANRGTQTDQPVVGTPRANPVPPPGGPSLREAMRGTWKAFRGATPTLHAVGLLVMAVFAVEIVLSALTWYFGVHSPEHLHDTMNVALGVASPYVKGMNVFLGFFLAVWSILLLPAVFALILGLAVALHVANRA